MRRIIFQIILVTIFATAAIVRGIPEPAVLAIVGVCLALFTRSLQRQRKHVRRRSDRRTWGLAPLTTPLVLVKSETRRPTSLRKSA